jgi:uncharacterized membrane protein YtjA (UPF0391 family)
LCRYIFRTYIILLLTFGAVLTQQTGIARILHYCNVILFVHLMSTQLHMLWNVYRENECD